LATIRRERTAGELADLFTLQRDLLGDPVRQGKVAA
jgi:hypothetical protein